MIDSFYSCQELKQIGFSKIGENVQISRFARFYSPENIEIGNNVRIDDFCILSGHIKIGSFIHISAFNALYGKNGIQMNDYSGLSARCTVYSATDDFSGNYMVGTMVKSEYRNIIGGRVLIDKFSQVGCNCVVLPSVTIHEGVAVGAMSLVLSDLESWGVYKGIPAKFLKKRSEKLLVYLTNEL